MERKAYIVGYGQTRCGFFAARDMRSLISEAYIKALQNCGVEPRDIQQMWLSQYPLQCDLQSTAGQVAIDAVGLASRVGCITIEQACASGGQTIHDASLGIESGRYECIIVAGFAKMADSLRRGERVGNVAYRMGPYEESGFNPFYSQAGLILNEPGAGRDYVKGNVTHEDIAAWNLTEWWYATKHPNSLCFGETIPERKDLMANGGGPVDCSGCDGASVVILGSRDFARAHTDKLVYIAAASHKMESSYYAKLLDHGYGGDSPRAVAGPILYSHSVENVWKECFERAQIGPQDLDLLNAPSPVFTTYAHMEGMHHPEIPRGRAPKWFTEGQAYPNGKLPINTLGVARFGAPRGALGLNFLIENCMQLKEECGSWQVPIKNGLAAGCVSPVRPAVHILRREK
jgi:acetyl-CoA C-acetyltransferase